MNASAAPATPANAPDTANHWPAPPGRIWYGIFGGPAAWALQLGLGWYIEGSSCLHGTPQWGPLTAGGIRGLQLAVLLACLALVVGALCVALGAWRRSGDEHLDAIHARTRPDFLAAAALVVSAAFVMAVLWAGLSQLLLPLCERMR